MSNTDFVETGITIDGPRSRDLDDAVAIRRDGSDIVITVTTPDLTRTVEADSALDREAHSRGMTVYAGPTVIRPMLPKRISEGSASLLPGADRQGLSYDIRLNQELEVKDFSFRRTTFRSSGRYSHADAHTALHDGTHELHPLVTLGWDIANGLMNERRKAGGLAIYDLRSGWMTTEEGMLVRLASERRNAGYVIIQELMILTNRLAAAHAAETKVPLLFRNHIPQGLPTGDPAALRAIIVELSAMDSPEFKGMTAEKLFGWLRRMMGRAETAPTCRGHFGLGIAAYCHITSPIRRYSDILNQRALLSTIDPTLSPPDLETMAVVAKQFSDVEQAIREERENRYQETSMRLALSAVVQGAPALRQVPDNIFRRALLAAAEGKFSDKDTSSLRQELIARIDADRLPERDYLTIMFKASDAVGDEVIEHTIRTLNANPFKARQMWNYLSQTRAWPETPDILSRMTGPPHLPVFSAQVASPEDSRIITPPCYGTDKAVTESRAILLLLVTLAGLMPPKDIFDEWTTEPRTISAANKSATRPAEAVEPVEPAAGAGETGEGDETGKTAQDSKSALLETCAKNRWKADFITTQAGPSHAAAFHSVLTVIHETQTFETVGTASSKKAAEKEAARAMIEVLNRTDQLPNATVPSLTAGKNPISQVQEICQKRRLPLPTYSYNSEEATFICSLAVELPNGVQRWTATGRSKAEAKLKAASEAVPIMMRHP